ncbi:unnamed protein product, partial [Rotaria sordida]
MATKQGYLPICDPDFTPIAASTSNSFISRRAIDPSGRLGSLYDAYSDRVLSNSNINLSTQLAGSHRRPECFIKTCNVDECANLLKWWNIQDEQRLDVALQTITANGIGALINYSRPIDKYTRFIGYNYYSWTEYFEDDVFGRPNKSRSSRSDAHATHMIVLVNWGIDAIVVLQLPHDDEPINEIDNVLQKLYKRFIYQNATDRGIQYGDDQQTLEQKLLVDANCTHILCSDDYLYQTNQSKWYTLYSQLLKDRDENPQLKLIYVDFSYCSYKLNDFIILRTTEKKNNVDVPQSVIILTPEQSKRDESVNILLLGESGVGKSTFINAFANYLKFDKLKQAENNPIVLIPVSFIMTIDDNFTERLVKFEGDDTLSNEDHDHLGHSVTQHCKSYVFTLKDDDESCGRKLRIIDTPGIGYTYGSSQDDTNLQHILSHITNLTHLNAICILLKSNNTRLNIFFRSCFIQLIDMLPENTCDKIIFCFTNSRSTFYTPANTAPAVKTLLNSLPAKRIPFTKANTFCFDSESFRYLVARLNKIDFKEIEEEEYNDSWEKSSSESNRLLKHIRTKMSVGIVPNEWHSMKHAQLQINLMIRPMLEAMRNILRNLILYNSGSGKVSIELCPKIIKSATALCVKCSRESLQVADFWITINDLHVLHNKCQTCRCDPSDHYPIDYELGYKRCDDSANTSENDMTKMLDDLCQASAEFAQFL